MAGIVMGVLAFLVHTIGPTSATGRCVEHPRPEFFDPQSATGWDVTPNGLLAIFYGEHGNFPDHVSLHRIVAQGYDVSTLGELQQSFGSHVTVLHSSESAGALPYYYIFLTHPLLYGAGLDQVGSPERVWLDREEDGLNGNERRLPVPGLELP
jgi:hypothetical protein